MNGSGVYQIKHSPYSSHGVLLTLLPEPGNGRRVLDVGCAGGELSELLAARGYQVTAIDRQEYATSLIARGFDFVAADLDAGLPALDRRFAVVLCADVLEHLRDPGAFLADVRRVLEPGGCVFASLPNSGHLYFRLNVLLGRFPAHDRGLFDRTHLHFYTWQGWRELFRSAEFRIDDVVPTVVPFGLVLPQHKAVGQALEGLSFGAARLWKTLLAYQFVVVARPDPQ